MGRNLFCMGMGVSLMCSSALDAGNPKVLVIAHRGASGYVPEHTLEAVSLAYGMGADYIEQDLVLTKDGIPVVLHDIHLDTVTDVADAYPERHRSDGRFYAIDFTLDEIKRLRVSERIDHRTGQAAFPNRFPVGQGTFSVPTLEEEITLIQGLNRTTGRSVGIYPEIKAPAFHHEQGQDLSRITLQVIRSRFSAAATPPPIIQCFDVEESKRIRKELASEFPIVQLLGDQAWLRPGADRADRLHQLEMISEYAMGVGPSVIALFRADVQSSRRAAREFVEDAHAQGLQVHTWTYRIDGLPRGFSSFQELHAVTIEARVDAIFTDHPDQSHALLR